MPQPNEPKTILDLDPAVPEPKSEKDSSLYFQYYLHQWEQVRHVENTREKVTVQLLVISAGAIVGFYAADSEPVLQTFLSLGVVAIGLIGRRITIALEVAANIHIDRARVFRKHLHPLDLVASKVRGFKPLARYFIWLNTLICLYGIALFYFSVDRVFTDSHIGATSVYLGAI